MQQHTCSAWLNRWISESEKLMRLVQDSFFPHTSTQPTIPLSASRSIASFITVCFVIIFLYTKPHFRLVEIDSSDDTKQFISPFIPCFVLIAPPPAPYSVPLCVSEEEWEEMVGRLIGCCANCQALWLSWNDLSDSGLLRNDITENCAMCQIDHKALFPSASPWTYSF